MSKLKGIFCVKQIVDDDGHFSAPFEAITAHIRVSFFRTMPCNSCSNGSLS